MRWHLSHKVHGTKPWDVQVEAMKRSEGRPRYGFFVEMGLGKTALTLNDFVNSDYPQALVLAPNSFKTDWALAPDEWGVGEDMITSAWPSLWAAYERKQKSFSRILLAMNYEAMRAGRGLIKAEQFLSNAPTMLIIDESSAIKNHSSQTTKAVLRLLKGVEFVRELNGTPIVQNVMDYWPQLRALGELDGVNPFAFRNRFAVMGGFMGKQVVGIKNEDELYRILDRCSFRARKEDWRDLPPKTYSTVHLEMTDRQHKAYKTMLDDFYLQVNGLEVTADMVLAQMNKLRQISSCLVMQDGAHEWLEEPDKNPKIRAVLDLISNGRGKAIVSYFYRPSGEALFDALKDAKMYPAHIRGGLSPQQIINEKKRFNDESRCRVIVGQVAAISRGHTLLGQAGSDRCSTTICFENSFERLHRAHLEDRNHRGEQDQNCVVYDLITSPMDQIAVDILTRKKDMADAIDDVVAVVRRHAKSR